MTDRASYNFTVVCTEVDKVEGLVRLAPLQRDVPSPFPATVVFVDIDEQERTIHAQSAKELGDLLSLENDDYIADDIAQVIVNGTVYCTLCPHTLQVHESRQLMFASTREDLERNAMLAAESI